MSRVSVESTAKKKKKKKGSSVYAKIVAPKNSHRMNAPKHDCGKREPGKKCRLETYFFGTHVFRLGMYSCLLEDNKG